MAQHMTNQSHTQNSKYVMQSTQDYTYGLILDQISE